jgi:hypothetical protein
MQVVGPHCWPPRSEPLGVGDGVVQPSWFNKPPKSWRPTGTQDVRAFQHVHLTSHWVLFILYVGWLILCTVHVKKPDWEEGVHVCMLAWSPVGSLAFHVVGPTPHPFQAPVLHIGHLLPQLLASRLDPCHGLRQRGGADASFLEIVPAWAAAVEGVV